MSSARSRSLFFRMRSALAALAVLFALFLAAAPRCAAAEEPQLVRVGYAQLQGFLYQNADGSYAGYAYDLLQQLATYNNWEYEFTETSYAQCRQQLEQGEIDIFIPYQKTADRAAVFEYSDQVFCTNEASLLTLPASPICYEDFAAMDGITLGSVQNTRNSQRFVELLQEHGCTVTLRDQYLTQADLLAAVKSGELDAFISASSRGVTDCKIIAILPQTSSYVIARKGDRAVLDKIDSALLTLRLAQPNFAAALNEKYQLPEGGTSPSLTREETEYIAQKQQVTVLVSAAECDSDGQFAGSAKRMFDEISAQTGLTFIPLPRASTAQILTDFQAGQADIVYAFYHDYEWAKMHGAWLTESYSDFYNKVVMRPGLTSAEMKTVAVVPGSYIEYQLDRDTDLTLVDCDTYQDCVEAVLHGKADAAYFNSPIGNYYSTFPKYSRLSFLSAYDYSSSFCMGVAQSGDPLLVQILDKSISSLPPQLLAQSFEEQLNSRPIAYTDFYYSNPVLAIAVLLVCAGVLLSLIFMLIINRTTHKKNLQLAAANRAKTDFMSRMSHDMRTPMNGILGLAHLTKTETNLDVIHQNLDQITLSGRFLLNLINDTLDMNKLDSGNLKLHPAPINSEKVFGNIITTAGILAKEKGVELKLELPPIPHGQWVPVMADDVRLEQILLNVISNAVKFTPKGSTVTLSMQTVSVENGIVRDKYVVRDTGCGMSPEFLPHLFEPFSQESHGDSANGGEGTGLGMSIVKRLVELMNGEISVTSTPGKGTEVTLLMQYPICQTPLPDDAPAALPDGAPPADLSVLAGKRVLLCEDHDLNAQIAIQLLQKVGMTTDRAVNGKAGLEMFRAALPGQYDAVLMDIRMPVMDGLAATRAIRALDKADAKTVPIIAMTANAYDEDIRQALSAGMNRHLSKPVEPQKMYAVLAEVMAQ